jgi:putative addiction module CopG family antidote
MPIQRTTLNVSLTPALEQFIAERVSSGRYQTASEVVRAGLRLLEQAEAAHAPTTAEPWLSKGAMERA